MLGEESLDGLERFENRPLCQELGVVLGVLPVVAAPRILGWKMLAIVAITGKSKGARIGRPFPHSAPSRLWTEHRSERRVVARVSVPVPGTRTSGRSRAHDFPVAWKGRGTRNQYLAALTGYRVDDRKGERRRYEDENSTGRHYQRGELLPHLRLPPPSRDRALGPSLGSRIGRSAAPRPYKLIKS